jgi:gamma-glutamyltranspeptidase/glutathione hydrolase
MAAVFQLLSFVADFGMDPEIAGHQPRIDVSDPGHISADRRLPPEVLSLLSEDGAVDIVDHSVIPVNFACPNLIVQQPDGTRVGMSDAVSPWSAAVAQAQL